MADKLKKLLYSKAETREIMGGVSLGTFNDWMARGLIVPVKIGRRAFFKAEDITRLAGGEPRKVE